MSQVLLMSTFTKTHTMRNDSKKFNKFPFSLDDIILSNATVNDLIELLRDMTETFNQYFPIFFIFRWSVMGNLLITRTFYKNTLHTDTFA